MKVEKVRAAVLGCAVLVLVVPASAQADRGYEIKEKILRTEMRLPGSHGYAISLRTSGHDEIEVEASKGSVSAMYRAPAHVTHRQIDADLGPLGRVSVRFDGRIDPPAPTPISLWECKGRSSIRESGRFRGVIRFSGEQGFTQVRATKAQGTVTKNFRRVCRLAAWIRALAGALGGSDRAESDLRFPITLGVAGSKSGGKRISLRTIGLEGPRRGIRPGQFIGFGSADLRERQGQISILRSAAVELDRNSVLLGDKDLEPRTATVSLPKPFGGEATYVKEPETISTWSGSLSVWLPGIGAVPLAGPGFVAAICRSKNETSLRRCTAPAEKELGAPSQMPLLPLFHGSGSQSQELLELRLSSSR